MSPRPAPIRWNEVSALYGGTFDPPHAGHRKVVDGLFSEPGVARVLVTPAPSPPHKPTVASSEDRVAMTRLTFAPSAAFPLLGPVELELSELERARAHPSQPSYTFDTLTELRRKTPHLAFVIGTDQLLKLHTWNRFPELLTLSHWIVLERKGSEATESAGPQVLAQWEASGLVKREGNLWRTPGGTGLQLFKTPAPAISSTQVREAIVRDGQPPEGALLPEARAYLMQRGIYGTRPSPAAH